MATNIISFQQARRCAMVAALLLIGCSGLVLLTSSRRAAVDSRDTGTDDSLGYTTLALPPLPETDVFADNSNLNSLPHAGSFPMVNAETEWVTPHPNVRTEAAHIAEWSSNEQHLDSRFSVQPVEYPGRQIVDRDDQLPTEFPIGVNEPDVDESAFDFELNAAADPSTELMLDANGDAPDDNPADDNPATDDSQSVSLFDLSPPANGDSASDNPFAAPDASHPSNDTPLTTADKPQLVDSTLRFEPPDLSRIESALIGIHTEVARLADLKDEELRRNLINQMDSRHAGPSNDVPVVTSSRERTDESSRETLRGPRLGHPAAKTATAVPSRAIQSPPAGIGGADTGTESGSRRLGHSYIFINPEPRVPPKAHTEPTATELREVPARPLLIRQMSFVQPPVHVAAPRVLTRCGCRNCPCGSNCRCSHGRR